MTAQLPLEVWLTRLDLCTGLAAAVLLFPSRMVGPRYVGVFCFHYGWLAYALLVAQLSAYASFVTGQLMLVVAAHVVSFPLTEGPITIGTKPL